MALNDTSKFTLLNGTPGGTSAEALQKQHEQNIDLLVNRFPQFERSAIQAVYDEARAPLDEGKISTFIPVLAYKKAREILKEKEQAAG